MADRESQSGPRIDELSVEQLVKLRDDIDRRLSENGAAAAGSLTPEEKRRLLDEMREIADLPMTGPRDGFSGADHDEALYGRKSKPRQGE